MMAARSTLLGVLALCSSAAVAAASDIPRYDPEGYCKRVAELSGGSAIIESGCMDMEQSSYNKLKPMWSDVPEKTRKWCDTVAKSSGRGSYMLLEGCIDMEYAAKKKTDTGKFKF